MIEIRPFAGLGQFRNDWLDAHHHFSFADYYDPARMGWGPLRVWNDDTIRPDSGFPPHGHRDMEIITYVRKGAISHEDGLGNKGRTVAGDVQVMSAGTGIMHAEFNREDEDTQIFQIWILPRQRNLPPRWESRRFPERDGGLQVLASGRPGDEGALSIHQDAAILGASLAKGQVIRHDLTGRSAYLVSARGRLKINGHIAEARDGVAVANEAVLEIEALEDGELILADLPG